MSEPSEPSAEPATQATAASGRGGQPLDGAMTRALVAVGGVGVLLAVGALALFGAATGLGVAAGAAVALANLWVFALVVRGVLSGSRGRLWGLLAALKFLALMLGVYLLLQSGASSALALVVGYGALPAGITLGSLLGPDEPPPANPSA